MPIIRVGTLADSPAIAALWNLHITGRLTTFNHQPKTADDVAALITRLADEGQGMWVVEADGTLLGFAYYSQFRGGIGYAHSMEHTLYLADEAAGRGLGRGLLAAVEDHARAAGAHVMMAGVSAANGPGLAFHERCGYAEVARLREVGRKFGQWLDLVLMQKFL